AHLEECASCQHALEELTAQRDSWTGAAQQLAEQAPDAPSALRDVMDNLKDLGTTMEKHPDAAALDSQDFSFLTPSDQPGHIGRFDHYEILELIGKGGFGLVFKAHDEALDRVVALKVLSPALASSATARKRFIREAKAAAAVRNEHVINIHAVND